jgi:hypothetical protein
MAPWKRRHLGAQHDEFRQFLGRLDTVRVSGFNADEFPTPIVAPVLQDRTANRASLRVHAIGIQESIDAKHWNLVDEGVAAVVSIDGHDSGLTVVHEPDNFNGKLSKFGAHRSHSTRDSSATRFR